MKKLSIAVLSILALVVSYQSVLAESDEGIKGWEIDSEYNSHYNAKELDKFKGKITKFVKVTPLPGMAPGTGFYFDEGAGEPILVHLCPASFASAKATGLKKNIKTKIRGSWATIDGKDVFMASKVKQGEHFSFKARLTSNGKPFWTMDAEELAYERANQ